MIVRAGSSGRGARPTVLSGVWRESVSDEGVMFAPGPGWRPFPDPVADAWRMALLANQYGLPLTPAEEQALRAVHERLVGRVMRAVVAPQ